MRDYLSDEQLLRLVRRSHGRIPEAIAAQLVALAERGVLAVDVEMGSGPWPEPAAVTIVDRSAGGPDLSSTDHALLDELCGPERREVRLTKQSHLGVAAALEARARERLVGSGHLTRASVWGPLLIAGAAAVPALLCGVQLAQATRAEPGYWWVLPLLVFFFYVAGVYILFDETAKRRVLTPAGRAAAAELAAGIAAPNAATPTRASAQTLAEVVGHQRDLAGWPGLAEPGPPAWVTGLPWPEPAHRPAEVKALLKALTSAFTAPYSPAWGGGGGGGGGS
ncbi:hypothetical protein AB0M36_10585 [Actinoplanes sp. NPDC051346]|uniref:hypothetical protein n=1 Tax=Actinoplanes sp. NPDC051346 TaxID=3155048 RepID=UPI0034333E4E